MSSPRAAYQVLAASFLSSGLIQQRGHSSLPPLSSFSNLSVLPGGKMPLIASSPLSPFSSQVLRPQSCCLYQDACFDPCLFASQFISLHENGQSSADGVNERAVAELWLQHSLQCHCLSAQLRPLLGDRQYIRKFYTGTWRSLSQDRCTYFFISSTLLFLYRLILTPGPILSLSAIEIPIRSTCPAFSFMCKT